jgi:transcriptional regulator with XRE-family HTH domain
VRDARRRFGVTQAEAAELIGTAPEIISRIERGKALPSIPMLRRICVALKVEASNLLGLGGQQEPVPVAAPPSGLEGPLELQHLFQAASKLGDTQLRLLCQLALALEQSLPGPVKKPASRGPRRRREPPRR